ncbi:MAG: PatB family C-S lyase [Cocleimonas sp.]
MFDFNKVTDRKHSFSEKWDKYKDSDTIPMWIADSDFETAPVIIQALHERVEHGIFGYTEQPTSEVKDAIIYHLSKQHDWQIDRDWIVPLSSIVNGLTISCMVASQNKPKNKVDILVPETIYPPFNYVTSNTGNQAIRVPIILEEERWILDFDALESLITPETKLLLFCNPHNPAGTVYTQDELTRLHQICKTHDILICSDEIHCDLILSQDKKHISIAKLNEDANHRTITLMAASKTYNIAGLSFGFAIIAEPELRKKFSKIVLELMPETNLLGQVATTAAFKQGESWRLQQIDFLRSNRDYLLKEINSIPELKMYPLDATYLAWIDISKLKLKDAVKFFEKAGVGISPGTYFGNANFIRLNFACRRGQLEEVVKRIKTAVTSL